jgi:YgiT-type zinc finger domain-containing protein
MKKISKACEACGGKNTKTHLAIYPVKIGEKQINVERVSVRECLDCKAIKPTSAGQAKIARCTMTFMSLFD